MLEKLKQQIDDGYKIVIFTNQKGISTGKISVTDITGKLEDIQKELNIPLMAFIAKEMDYYRKPSIGMWKLLQSEFNNNIEIDINNSKYIGDAAGRLKNSKGKKDFSSADLLFALNIKIPFFIPEAFFLAEKNFVGKPKFEPRNLDGNKDSIKSFDLTISNLSGKNDILIFCGSPGSGKTNLYHNHLKKLGYEHVNQDQLKTEQKCLKKAEEYLKEGKAICVDSTNPTIEKRKAFIDLAKKMNATIRCFYFNYEKELVFHLNNLREVNPFRDNYTKSVADVVIHTWFKRLNAPEIKEGFDDLHIIEFIPGPFESKEDEEVFYLYQ